LEALARSKPDLDLRRIDVPNWRAPVVSQYGVRSLPYLLLYRDGKLVAKGTREVLAAAR